MFQQTSLFGFTVWQKCIYHLFFRFGLWLQKHEVMGWMFILFSCTIIHVNVVKFLPQSLIVIDTDSLLFPVQFVQNTKLQLYQVANLYIHQPVGFQLGFLVPVVKVKDPFSTCL